MNTPKLSFRAGFWDDVAWGAPDSPVRPLCAKCHGPLPEVPLMLSRDDGSMIQLCNKCTEAWLVMV